MTSMIYLDNAATTWPKPKKVQDAVNSYFNKFAGSPNRTENSLNFITDVVRETREKVAKFFCANEEYNVVFVSGATVGMNLVLNSLLKHGDHVVTTNCEHHAVYRPLQALVKKGINYDIANYIDKDHKEYPEKIFEKITSATKAVIVNHGSNVTGAVFDIKKLGKELKKREITFIVDISQTVGIEDIELNENFADILITSTHKHLFGLPGLGFIIYRKNIPLLPLYYGGTGNNSGFMDQPVIFPDMLEAGTMNLPAILALSASLEFCNKKNRNDYRKHEKNLITRFIEGCSDIPKIKLYCRKEGEKTGTVSFNIQGMDPNYIVAPYLANKGKILIRSGLHCAPVIHKTIGSYPTGTNRISVSIFNTENDIDELLNSLDILGRYENG